MLLNIPEEMAEQLEQLAQQQGRSILDLLASWISSHQEAPPGSLAELAQNAREANLASAEEVDTAANSREILNNEYADHLHTSFDYDTWWAEVDRLQARIRASGQQTTDILSLLDELREEAS